MVVLNTKNLDELIKDGIKKLESVGIATTPGSIAKLFLNIVNKNIADLYDTLSINHIRAFVTTADNDALDAIGVLMHCSRIDGESDDNYRFRITNQCLTLATSNETSIYLTALTVDGVKDIVLKPYSMGAGTFTVIVLTDDAVTSDEILAEVRTKLNKVYAYGIRFNVVTPHLTYVSIRQKINFSDLISDVEKQEIRYNVQLAVSQYLSKLSIGEDIIIDKLTQIIMNVSTDIISTQNISFFIDGEKSVYTNQSCRWFERFIISPETNNVVIL